MAGSACDLEGCAEKGRELGRRGEPSAEGMVCAADTCGSKNWAKFEEGGEQDGKAADPAAERRCVYFWVTLGVRLGANVLL